jgi:hypothetical protein
MSGMRRKICSSCGAAPTGRRAFVVSRHAGINPSIHLSIRLLINRLAARAPLFHVRRRNQLKYNTAADVCAVRQNAEARARARSVSSRRSNPITTNMSAPAPVAPSCGKLTNACKRRIIRFCDVLRVAASSSSSSRGGGDGNGNGVPSRT